MAGVAATYLLEQGYLPEDINRKTEEELLQELKSGAYRSIGIQRIRHLKQAASSSAGINVASRMARKEMQYLAYQLVELQGRLEVLEKELEEIVQSIPGADLMIAIQGVGPMTVVAFFAEVGDLSKYRDPRQIIKLAGLNLKMNQSGTFKGETTITKRGRRRLRSILYQVARSLALHNDGFKTLYQYLINRSTNPLKAKEAYIALSRKLIKVLFVIGTRQCSFSSTRMIQDIPHLSDVQEVA